MTLTLLEQLDDRFRISADSDRPSHAWPPPGGSNVQPACPSPPANGQPHDGLVRDRRPFGIDHLDRPSILGPDRDDDGHDHDELPAGGGPTLEDVISGAWEGLAATRTAPCPVCSGTLVARYGSGPGPVAGRCRDCGSELS